MRMNKEEYCLSMRRWLRCRRTPARCVIIDSGLGEIYGLDSLTRYGDDVGRTDWSECESNIYSALSLAGPPNACLA